MARTGATVRALRYYESCGLVVPQRSTNGYRDYSELDVALVEEIRQLTALGLTVMQTKPLLNCLRRGHRHSDDCPESLAAYRRGLQALDRLIEPLLSKRTALAARLDAAASRGVPTPAAPRSASGSGSACADGDADSPADRLLGRQLPPVTLRTTQRGRVVLARLPGITVVYLYPLTGRPGVDLPEGWDTIPGARGCTAEACGFRDHHRQLREAGADAVFGLSSQSPPYQREMRYRLQLPFEVLSDPTLRLAGALDLPTFSAGRTTLYRRLTLIVRDGVVEHVMYPVEAPDRHAEQVLRWLEQHRFGSVTDDERQAPRLRERAR
jgi:peroxiredoxin/DNA-binding transcriptional MerR regulator